MGSKSMVAAALTVVGQAPAGGVEHGAGAGERQALRAGPGGVVPGRLEIEREAVEADHAAGEAEAAGSGLHVQHGPGGAHGRVEEEGGGGLHGGVQHGGAAGDVAHAGREFRGRLLHRCGGDGGDGKLHLGAAAWRQIGLHGHGGAGGAEGERGRRGAADAAVVEAAEVEGVDVQAPGAAERRVLEAKRGGFDAERAELFQMLESGASGAAVAADGAGQFGEAFGEAGGGFAGIVLAEVEAAEVERDVAERVAGEAHAEAVDGDDPGDNLAQEQARHGQGEVDAGGLRDLVAAGVRQAHVAHLEVEALAGAFGESAPADGRLADGEAGEGFGSVAGPPRSGGRPSRFPLGPCERRQARATPATRPTTPRARMSTTRRRRRRHRLATMRIIGERPRRDGGQPTPGPSLSQGGGEQGDVCTRWLDGKGEAVRDRI